MNITKIILCGREEYEKYHRPKGLVCAYMNREHFLHSLPKLKKRTWNIAHEDESDNIPFSFEELVHSSIEIFTKG